MSSIDAAEIASFSAHAPDWWNPNGAMKPLHKITPARLDYIRAQIDAHFKKTPLKKLSVLDIGCGGGLICEPLAREGAKVTGIDASREGIKVAKAHAAAEKLRIDYRNTSAEALAKTSEKFDVILLLEILEHAADVGSLLRSAAALLKPDGLMIFSTVNRTTKSFLFGIVGAEYLLKWMPVGTHDWNRFVRPSELAAHLQKTGMTMNNLTGIIYNPLTGGFSLSEENVSINYLASAAKDR